MDFTKNYINWISGLTKDQFDIFIKAFIKDYWRIESVVITDGKGDGGIDIKILENKNRKIPIQLTIDKNVYNKLRKDFVKISQLIEDHNYSDSLYFFYSNGAAEDKVIDLVDEARGEYLINLEFFDNKRIASYLDKPNFVNSRESLRNLLGEFLRSEDSYFDENQKLYFDYLSYGDDSKELKERFIRSYILHELYKVYPREDALKSLILKIEKEFNIKVSESYCSRLLNSLVTSEKILKTSTGHYKLCALEKNNISKIRNDSELLEKNFSSRLQDLINSRESSIEIRKVIEKLNSIFASQNKIDLNEISGGIDLEDSSAEIRSLYDYIRSSFNYNEQDSKKFISDIFKLCMENNFLAKISAGKLFKDLMNNPEFSAYSRRTNKEVFIDTPILIYLLLVMREPHSSYNNYKYSIAKELFDLIQAGGNSACYNTTQLYIMELADHFKNAVKLLPIQELNIFDSLGGSDNEILNFYTALKKEGIFEGSFKEYLESYGVALSKVENDESDEYLNQVLIRIFKDNHILIDDVIPYNLKHETKKLYDRIEKALADIYSRHSTSRRPRSLKFDALLFCHIYEFDDLIDPTIVTWDKTFSEFRRDFQPKNPNLKYWHLFTPGKFLDHMSLLKFQINGGAISKEILSMIETEYEVIKSVKKLSDVLTTIIDLKSTSGIALSTGLADIRNTYIYQINKGGTETVTSEESLPVDTIVADLVDYYSRSIGLYDFKDFINTLKMDNVVNDFLAIVKKENDLYLNSNKFSYSYRTEFDDIIKVMKNTANDSSLENI